MSTCTRCGHPFPAQRFRLRGALACGDYLRCLARAKAKGRGNVRRAGPVSDANFTDGAEAASPIPTLEITVPDGEPNPIGYLERHLLVAALQRSRRPQARSVQ